jgi:hypothetical protein
VLSGGIVTNCAACEQEKLTGEPAPFEGAHSCDPRGHAALDAERASWPSVWISGTADMILSLDRTAHDRGVECIDRQRRRMKRGWSERVQVRGSKEDLGKLARELDDVAAGLQCDDLDDPAAGRRAARAAAEQIRKQLG